jgi:hypothetical protein
MILRNFLNKKKSEQPTFKTPLTQIVTTNQFCEPDFKKWACQELGWQFGFNRKLWEYSFILNAIDFFGKSSGRGLGFGVGREPIVPVLLRNGAKLVVTDLEDEQAQIKGWDSMSFNLNDNPNIEFSFVDMNSIPPDLNNFDFLWSCGSLEHIGGLEHGLEFIKKSMNCLNPGGLAVHTTEFNVHNGYSTYSTPGLSLYRQKDIEKLAYELRALGHNIDFNFNLGNHELDKVVSDEFSPWEISLKVKLEGYIVTSIGIIVHKSIN